MTIASGKICALCGIPKALCKSHIIPKRQYKEIFQKDGTNRSAYQISSQFRTVKKCQDGEKIELLCRDCESFLNIRYEIPFRKFWYEKYKFQEKQFHGINADINSINYREFKLFHLSVLWRIAVAREGVYARIDIGSGAEEAIRKMLLDGDPSREDTYPLVGIVNRGSQHCPRMDIVGAASRYVHEELDFLSVFYAGCEWFFFLREPPKKYSDLRYGYLKEGGTISLAVQDFHRNAVVYKVAEDCGEAILKYWNKCK